MYSQHSHCMSAYITAHWLQCISMYTQCPQRTQILKSLQNLSKWKGISILSSPESDNQLADARQLSLVHRRQLIGPVHLHQSIICCCCWQLCIYNRLTATKNAAAIVSDLTRLKRPNKTNLTITNQWKSVIRGVWFINFDRTSISWPAHITHFIFSCILNFKSWIWFPF